jgi:hypothetical protein
VSGNGDGATLKIDSGRLVLKLTAAPQYVTLGKADLQ